MAVLPTDLPDRQSLRIPVQPHHQKYFAFSETQISRTVRPSRFPQEGRIAIVTNVERDAMDAGGISSTNDAAAYGKGVWS